MQDFKDIESPTRVHRLNKQGKPESKVVSAREAKGLIREGGWYSRRKHALDAAEEAAAKKK